MTPLVLLPGLGNTAALFTPLDKAMGDQDVRHANLIDPKITDFEGMLDHVRGQLPQKPFDLLGFSMGGYVALALALEQSLPIRRLILLNSRAADDGRDEAGERARTLRLLENPKTRFEGMTWGLFQTLVGPEHQDDGAVFEAVRGMAQDVGRFALAAQIRSNQTRPNMVADLGRLTLPTLIVGGELDGVTPPAEAERLHQGIKGSQLHILEGCGHLGPLERPDELAAHIEKFVRD